MGVHIWLNIIMILLESMVKNTTTKEPKTTNLGQSQVSFLQRSNPKLESLITFANKGKVDGYTYKNKTKQKQKPQLLKERVGLSSFNYLLLSLQLRFSKEILERSQINSLEFHTLSVCVFSPFLLVEVLMQIRFTERSTAGKKWEARGWWMVIHCLSTSGFIGNEAFGQNRVLCIFTVEKVAQNFWNVN